VAGRGLAAEDPFRHHRRGSFAFLACFSRNSEAKESTHQSEEVLLAIEEMRRPAFARRSFRFFNPGMRRFAGRRFGGTF